MKEATLQKKVDSVNAVAEKIKTAKSIVVVNPIGLTVAEVSQLRTKLYENGCTLAVEKNNILRRAVKANGFDFDEFLKGPSALAYSNEDSIAAAKVVFEYAKSNNKLEIRTGLVDGAQYNYDELKVLSTLPDKNGMLSMLLSVLQAPIRNVACAIKAVADKQNA